MKQSEFKNEYYGNFSQTPRDRILIEFGTRYHDKCDRFDKFFCSGADSRGIPMPKTMQQSAQINRNAHEVRRELKAEYIDYHFTTLEIQRAIRNGVCH